MGKKKKNSNYVTEKKIKAREEALKAKKAYRTKKITISTIAVVLAITCLVVGIILIANAIQVISNIPYINSFFWGVNLAVIILIYLAVKEMFLHSLKDSLTTFWFLLILLLTT